MKVQCDVCEKAAATLLCCADEAALCGECDKQVHAANELAGKHKRVPFIGQDPSSCDICQERSGHFFCIEDRALLCRDCDVSVHTANKQASKHKRFLVSGVRVGLEAMAPPHSPPLLKRKPSIANITTLVPNAQESVWPSPPPLPVEKTHASVQTLKYPNPQAITWPSCPIIAPTSHPQQLTSPPSTINFSDCLVHLDELLNINTSTTTFTENASRMSIPNLGWALPNNTLAWDVLNASTCLFEDSLAEVPSTPTPPIQDPGSLKRKRPMNELTYSSFDHTVLVPHTISYSPYKHTWWQ